MKITLLGEQPKILIYLFHTLKSIFNDQSRRCLASVSADDLIRVHTPKYTTKLARRNVEFHRLEVY